VRKLARELPRDAIVLLSLSGRGDKDAAQVRDRLRAQASGSR
jgi:tryptophan synthase beta subunit